MNKKESKTIENTSGIYIIKSPSDRVYIGQSVLLRDRYLAYLRLECTGQIRLYNSFIKHGIENHIFNIVEHCEIEHLNERERFWQDYYKVVDKCGLNCRLTTSFDKSGKLSLKVVEKRNKTRELNKSACKIVYQYSKDGKLLNTFISTKQCSEILKIKRSSVIGCASNNSRLQTYKGFVFSYIELDYQSILNRYKKSIRIRRKHTIESKIKMSESRIKYLNKLKNE